MRAVSVGTAAPDGRPALSWTTVPEPVPRPGEVLIEVAAAGVNRADLLQARGRYPVPAGASEILGLECSGTIISADPALGFAPGTPVCALLTGGGYAERVAVPATAVLPVPRGVPLEDAAGLPEAACTVWSNLVMTAGLQAGGWLLVHGGSSGIGTMAIQIGKAIGARVAVTASTAEKLVACRDLGADVLIDYLRDDFVQQMLTATGGHGAGVILDVVGGDYAERNIAALADGGRIVVIGLLGGSTARIDLAALMAKRAGIIGTQLRTRPETGPGSKADVVAQVREHVWPWLEAGTVRPVIGARLPMDQAAQAHQLLRDGAVVGKVVLTRP